ncbi:MAG: hypothetical protein ACLTDX_06185 [[Clostridium] innocuum]
MWRRRRCGDFSDVEHAIVGNASTVSRKISYETYRLHRWKAGLKSMIASTDR